MKVSRIGLVVHPSRPVDGAVAALRRWADAHGAEVGQIPLEREQRWVAEALEADAADLIVAIGGDGTTLAAIHSSADCATPVLGVACGSLGVLTSVDEDGLDDALERICAGDWTERRLPALEVRAGGDSQLAFNDLVVVRAGEGQVRVSASVDGELYARFAGDGCIVATPLGSSAYTMAAGGPLLELELPAFLLTPLPAHGGSRPPLVIRAGTELKLEVSSGFGGHRLEVDGQLGEQAHGEISISLQEEAARVVVLPGQEGLIAGLRRRGVITDSPRILAEDARARGESAA